MAAKLEWQMSEVHRPALDRQAEERHHHHKGPGGCTATTRARPRGLGAPCTVVGIELHPHEPALEGRASIASDGVGRSMKPQNLFSAPSQTQRTVAELAACRQELQAAIFNKNLGVQDLEMEHCSKISSECLSSVTPRREVEPFQL